MSLILSTVRPSPRRRSRPLTPSHHAELEDVRRHVDVKDFDQGEVHVNCLQSHPGERCQEEVVQCRCHGHTEAPHLPGGQPRVDQKDQIEAQQRQRQIEEDLRRVVTTQLPAGGDAE